MTSVRDNGSTSTDKTSPFYTTGKNRNLYSSNNPNVIEPFSDLKTLSIDAMRLYGETAPEATIGDMQRNFLRFANQIIEDLRAHPYWRKRNIDIDYYKSYEEFREIPDAIMLAGLQFYYADQQQSKKVDAKGRHYFRTLNGVLYNLIYGHKKIEMQPPDKTDFTKVGTTDKIDPNERYE